METKIKVIARCRPLIGDEQRTGRRCLSIAEDVVCVGDKRFAFERVFDESTTQEQLYDTSIRSLVDGCFEGFNATVFAYGQTGSGKTHSIMGSVSEEDDSGAGIIPRAVHQVFAYLQSDKAAGRMANVRVSMIELYNDECKDLLHPEIPSRDIVIREDKLGRMFFTGAREEVVSSAAAALQFVDLGNLHRTTAETLMNQNSSRSHAIFTLSLEMLEYNKDSNNENSLIQAKLHLIDLAGSERNKRTGAVGTRFKESVGINQGLLALGKVIRALTASPPSQHVPYRESKLTRFLQDSLGGNSNTMLLACISPLESNLHETISSLQYAQRAKAIQNRLTANVSTAGVNSNLEMQGEIESALVVSLRAEIERLRERDKEKEKERLGMHGDERDRQKDRVKDKEKEKDAQRELTKCLQTMRRCRSALLFALESESERGLQTEREGDLRRVSKDVVTLLSDALSESERDTHRDGERDGLMRTSMTGSLAALRSSLQLAEWDRERNADTHTGTDADTRAELRRLKEDYEAELFALREELSECQDDLQRDEEIFAEKMKELKAVKKTLKETQSERDTLKESEGTLREQLAKLNLALAPHKQTAMERDGESKHAHGELTEDDLDLSLAVARTEPDVSQLLEDLETLSREKHDLLRSVRDEEERHAETHTRVSELEDALRTETQEREREKARYEERVSSLEEALRVEREEKQKMLHGRDEDEEMLAKERREKDRERERERERDRETIAELRVDIEELQSENRTLSEQLNKVNATVTALTTAASHREKEIEMEREREKKRAAESDSESESDARASAVDGEGLSRWLDVRLCELEEQGLCQVEALRLQKALELLQSEKESVEKELSAQRHAVALIDQEIEKISSSAAINPSLTVSVQEREEERERETQLREMQQKLSQIEDKIKSLRLKASNLKLRTQTNTQTDDTEREKARREWSDLQFTIESYEEHKQELLVRMKQLSSSSSSANNNNNKSTKKEGDKDKAKEKALERERRRKEEAVVVVQDLQEDLEALMTEMQATQQRLDVEREKFAKLQKQRGPSVSLSVSDKPSTATTSGSLESQIDLLLRELTEYMHASRTSSLSASTAASKKNDKKNKNLSVSSARNLMRVLLQLLLRQRVKGGTHEQAVRQLKEQLESKCVDYDNLVKTMQKTRSEGLRRQEQLKKENEEKISFLVHQLRLLEGKQMQQSQTMQQQQLLQSSEKRALSPSPSSSRPQSTASTIHSGRRPPSSARDRERDSPMSTMTPTRLHNSVSKRNMTELLAAQLHGRPSDDHGHNGSADPDHAQEINNEILQRYAAEKERREQLEKRNIELAKELRALRSTAHAAQR